MVIAKHKWLVIQFIPVSLFSLRMSVSTSSGGKTLFVPTPYTCKLALVNAGFRMGGEEKAQEIFDCVKDKVIRFNPPKHLIVNHTFIKIKREPKTKDPLNPFISTIGYREFCFYKGLLRIAVNINDIEDKVPLLIQAFARVNYFGKRGSFFQYYGNEIAEGSLNGFSSNNSIKDGINLSSYGVSQFLDDLSNTDDKKLWEKVNSYSSAKLTLEKERILEPTLLPYQRKETSRNYSYYINVESGT